MIENVFIEKEKIPEEHLLQKHLGSCYILLQNIREFVDQSIGETREEWKHYGDKTGWLLKKFYKKRNLFFIRAGEQHFLLSLVFGKNAVAAVMGSAVNEDLKKELAATRQYAEGKGLSIKVDNKNQLSDIYTLIKIKVGN